MTLFQVLSFDWVELCLNGLNGQVHNTINKYATSQEYFIPLYSKLAYVSY